ncbi:uncharacterized protein A4U43_C04F34000 [Asparagus officinalis]|uniref:Phytocyanin domain-containing protein n=1 Tax=Asparagus officinalis TaxID=4686 RepID=A0A5P1F5L0_ASPOF|nr:uncharacterized protein A4U43_C04F34000 [Asparagus officinalis]
MSIFWVLCILALLQIPNAQSTLYKVGDLDSWGVPPPTKSNAYASWSESHRFKIGDSLHDLAAIASNCGIKHPLSSAGAARLKAFEKERSGAVP